MVLEAALLLLNLSELLYYGRLRAVTSVVLLPFVEKLKVVLR